MRPLSCAQLTEQALIERYLSGRLSDDQVEAVESHYLTCPRCYDELRLGVAIREALPEVAELDLLQRPIHEVGIAEPATEAGAVRSASKPQHARSGRRIAARAAALAAAAMLAGLVVLRPPQPTVAPPPVHRDSATESALMLRAPVGDVATVREFQWQPLTAADRYRVTLYDTAGTVLWEAETADTRAALPARIRLEPGGLYLWEIAARVDWNRWVRSDMVQFEIQEH